MDQFEVRYPSGSTSGGRYRLLELPSDLSNLLESASGQQIKLEIKGHPTEDAVLCTANRTYALRSVVLSNSVLVVTPRVEHEDGDVVIQDTVNEVLELQPTVPKVHVLRSLLRGRDYDGEFEDENDTSAKNPYTYLDAKHDIQASDEELDIGLRKAHILTLKGQLRPITDAHLLTILELLLNTLVVLSVPHDSAPVEDLSAALQDEHDIPRHVSEQVMGWFGTLDSNAGKWNMDVDAVVRQIGIALLRSHRKEPIPEAQFLEKWRKAVGDTFEASVTITHLAGDYLASANVDGTSISYFPSAELPMDHAARFGSLFLARSRWKAGEIAPFLSDIAIDPKERDKLLLKYARANQDGDGIWYSARSQYTA
ncbi:hypothetical protein PUNSTDRAFT_131939 [Punctularia strigosozonata HHB-11173 SS5]|uniref:uncharacterized protein n=1 Tax=Punctularia strigosozonata (strain HHB-11173) TaxID=741275 RepID=UPI0004416DC1|nr:uncharacterized protein PUNSTDRAFT_131939 [Punctularia strigosozonata HHB-11173 SS5]EIN11786.1 hypothetical protein PUNSTDRAFT_131939 [Punctularia strigosozonata HHB-11173 SS5]